MQTNKKGQISRIIAFVFFMFVLLGVSGIIFYNYMNTNSNLSLTGNVVSSQDCNPENNVNREIKVGEMCSYKCTPSSIPGENNICIGKYDGDRNYCFKIQGKDYGLCVECLINDHCPRWEGKKCNPKTKTCEYSGVSSTACSDGKDNDGDGLIDYPKDHGCSSAGDYDEDNSPVPISGECNPDSARLDDNPCPNQGKCCIQSQNRFICGSCDNTENSSLPLPSVP